MALAGTVPIPHYVLTDSRSLSGHRTCICGLGRVACEGIDWDTLRIIPMKRLICGVALPVMMACLSPRAATAQASEPYVGEIQTFAFNFCPTGWYPLQGQLLPISQYEVLFNLIGTTFGGDGITTFALPKLGPIYTANGGACTSAFLCLVYSPRKTELGCIKQPGALVGVSTRKD